MLFNLSIETVLALSCVKLFWMNILVEYVYLNVHFVYTMSSVRCYSGCSMYLCRSTFIPDTNFVISFLYMSHFLVCCIYLYCDYIIIRRVTYKMRKRVRKEKKISSRDRNPPMVPESIFGRLMINQSWKWLEENSAQMKCPCYKFEIINKMVGGRSWVENCIGSLMSKPCDVSTSGV